MPREIDARIDALFVEGPDDGAVVNALVKKLLEIDLAAKPRRVIRANELGGGDSLGTSRVRRLRHENPARSARRRDRRSRYG